MIAAGFGFRASADCDSLLDAFRRANGSSGATVLATVADKADAEAFQRFAAWQDLPVYLVGMEELKQQDTGTQSGASLAARGVGSVAEAAALVAAGEGARLLGPRVVSGDGMATCALAEGGGQ